MLAITDPRPVHTRRRLFFLSFRILDLSSSSPGRALLHSHFRYRPLQSTIMLLFSGLYFLLHLLCLASVASSLPVKRVSSNAAALAAAACSEQIKARDLKGLAVCYILGASGQNKQSEPSLDDTRLTNAAF